MKRGRPKKDFKPIFHQVPIYNEEGKIIKEFSIEIKCPCCGSTNVTTNGTRQLVDNREIIYQCKDPNCNSRINNKRGKQFSVYTSFHFQKYINEIIEKIQKNIMHSSTTKSNIADNYSISPALITYLTDKIEYYIKNQIGLANLLLFKETDEAIAIDETFFKIGNETYYIIMATGYKSHKVLGLRISNSRKEQDIMEVYKEACNNTEKEITIISADAWGATQSMVKNLCKPITFIIHKHKKPYEKAVIWRIEYENDNRIITKIGVKTDVFIKRRKREFRVLIETESTQQPEKKKRGRPKGSKNKDKSKKKKQKKRKNKRGRKGIFKVFDSGKKYFARIDPYRNQIRLSDAVPPSAKKGLQDALSLYAKKHIQNNLSENKNNTIKTYATFCGPKNINDFDNHLRSIVIYDNNMDIIDKKLEHRFQGSTLNRHLYHSGVYNLMGIGV